MQSESKQKTLLRYNIGADFLLEASYTKQNSLNRITPLQQLIGLDKGLLTEAHVEAVLGHSFGQDAVAPFVALGRWRTLLAVALTLRGHGSLEQHDVLLAQHWRHLRSVAPWIENPLLVAYEQIVGTLINRSGTSQDREFDRQKIVGGACPLSFSISHVENAVPHPLFHAELGILLFLYADLLGSQVLESKAMQLAEWQEKTLDARGVPFLGLYSQEGEVNEGHLLQNSYILFATAARSEEGGRYSTLSAALLSRMQQRDDSDFPVYLKAFAQALSIDPSPEFNSMVDGNIDLVTLDPFEDRSFALVGCRSAELSIAATHAGSGSGMGCLHAGKTRIVSYGPQHLPLSDCHGFGIEGMTHLASGQQRQLRADQDQFILSGPMRMVIPKDGGQPVWIDVTQSYKDRTLNINTEFSGDFPNRTIGFTFFVNCQQCRMGRGKILKMRSLDRYHGISDTVVLESSGSSIEICPGQQHTEMHVIPLGGGANFWGADFLISFILDQEIALTWNLTCF